MPRIQPIDPAAATGKTKELLDGVQAKLGMTPNLIRTFAQSPAVLGAYLGFSGSLAGSTLSASLKEQLAVAIAGESRCDYCASAHTLLGKGAGVAADELALNLIGQSSDAKTAKALDFARAVVAKRGRVGDQDLANVRAAGWSEAEITEIVAVVALNLFTNYFNHIAETEIDFPLVDTGVQAAA